MNALKILVYIPVAFAISAFKHAISGALPTILTPKMLERARLFLRFFVLESLPLLASHVLKSRNCKRYRYIPIISLVWLTSSALAAVYPLTPGTDVVGEVQLITAHFEDSFITLAKKYDVGFLELVQANPDIDAWVPGEGTMVTLPTRYVLPPRDKRQGVVINLAELRLYYFPPNGKQVYTYPIGVGRMEKDWQTPLGLQAITQKQENTPWYPPASIREEAKREGYTYPASIPPGPDNPMGRLKMRLTDPNYLIHGTNREGGIGRRVSHGCINMFNADVEQLYAMIKIGTPVNIMHEPHKIGWQSGYLWVEAHEPLKDYRSTPSDYSLNHLLNLTEMALKNVSAPKMGNVEWSLLKQTFQNSQGVPVVIGSLY